MRRFTRPWKVSSYLLLSCVIRLRSSVITSSSVMPGFSAFIPSAHIAVTASVISVVSLVFSSGDGWGSFKGFTVVSGVSVALSVVEPFSRFKRVACRGEGVTCLLSASLLSLCLLRRSL